MGRYILLYSLKNVPKWKTRARNSTACVHQVAKKLQKKQKNVVDEGVKKLREKREAEQGRERAREEDRKREAQAREAPAALGRFFKK